MKEDELADRVRYLSRAAAWAAAFGYSFQVWEQSSLYLAKRGLTVGEKEYRLAPGEGHVET